MPPWQSKQCIRHMGLFLCKQETDLKSCLPLCADFPKKIILGMPKKEIPDSRLGGVLSVEKLLRCFDVGEVYRV